MYPDTLSPFASRQREIAFDAAFDCSTEFYAGIEKVVELNIQTVKTSLSEQKALADAALSAESLSDAVGLQSRQFRAAITKTFAYWRHAADIGLQTGNELFSAMHQHVESSLGTLAETCEVASGGFAAEEQGERVGGSTLLVSREPAEVVTRRVAIVDSAGKMVSTEDVRNGSY